MSTNPFSSTLPVKQGAAQINTMKPLGQRTCQQLGFPPRKTYKYVGQYPDTQLVGDVKYEDGILRRYSANSLPFPHKTHDHIACSRSDATQAVGIPFDVHFAYDWNVRGPVLINNVELTPQFVDWDVEPLTRDQAKERYSSNVNRV